MTHPDTAPTGAVPRPSLVFSTVALDTDEPKALADFYAALLGWEVTDVEEDWVTIRPIGTTSGPALACQLAINYRPPTWPDNTVPQQMHFDLHVPDLDEGERFALSLGARRAVSTVEEPSWRVFLDPSGHPFCLCQGG